MMKPTVQEDSPDPAVHCEHLRVEINGLIDHLRRDVDRVDEPQFKALSETAAEVLAGVSTAFDHYGRHSESAWRPSSPSARSELAR